MRIIFTLLGILFLQNVLAQSVKYEYHRAPIQKTEINFLELAKHDTLDRKSQANFSQPGGTQWPNPNTLSAPDEGRIKYEPMTKDVNQPDQPTVASPSPVTFFQALGDNNGQIPPDTHGAAGPNHLMTTLNTEIRIQDKIGNIISTQSLGNFWSSFTFSTIFDPRIHYDPFSNRWIFVVCIDKSVGNSSILIAVSANNDPTGTWYQWQVDADNSNTDWVDYPTVGFNNKWIVVSTNMFTNVGNAWAGPQIFTFDKADLYGNGTGMSSSIYPGLSVGGTYAPAVTYDNSVNSVFLVQDYNGNSSGWGYLGLSKIYGPTSTPLFSLHYSFPATSNTWNWSTGAADFAPQLGSTQKIQNNDSKMQNVVYRNGSLWCTHHVFLPATSSTHTAVQWWELDTTGTIIQRSRIEDLTGNVFYAFPSIAVNVSDDVLIGYSSFSSNQYASGSYSYRQASDAPNTMRTSYLYVSGLAPYYKTHTGTKNRWGDYSATVIDPTNDNDFWTIQEYAAQQVAGIDRWSTFWAKVDCALPLNTFSVSSNTTTTGTPITITADDMNGSTVFNWNFGGGNATPGVGQGPHTVSWNNSGIKTVTLNTVMNNCNAGQSAQAITVSDPVGFETIEFDDIQVYPNPFENSFMVSFEKDLDEILIFDTRGKLVYQNNAISAPCKVDLSNQSTGMYMVKLVRGAEVFDLKMTKR
jgi:hypothetical protein